MATFINVELAAQDPATRTKPNPHLVRKAARQAAQGAHPAIQPPREFNMPHNLHANVPDVILDQMYAVVQLHKVTARHFIILAITEAMGKYATTDTPLPRVTPTKAQAAPLHNKVQKLMQMVPAVINHCRTLDHADRIEPLRKMLTAVQNHHSLFVDAAKLGLIDPKLYAKLSYDINNALLGARQTANTRAHKASIKGAANA